MRNKLRICLLVLIAISVTLITIVLNESTRIAFYEPITSDDYEYLKECATKVVQTFDTQAAEDDSIEATYSIREGEQAVYIDVKLIRFGTVKCKLTAKYPIENIYKNFEIDDNVVNMNVSLKINYDEVTYTETDCILSMEEIIVIGIVMGIGAFLLFYYFTDNKKQQNEVSTEDDD